MKGLILKDIYFLKDYFKIYSAMFLFFLIYAVSMESPIYLVFMGMIMCVSGLFSVLAIDEASGFSFVMSLPVTRKQIVLEKYLFCGGMMALILGGTTTMGIFVNLYAKIDRKEYAFSALICAVFYIVMMSLIIPVTLKWGVQKARLVMLGCIAIPSALIVVWTQKTETNWMAVEHTWNQSWWIVAAGAFVTAVAVYTASYWISRKIFAQKEF